MLLILSTPHLTSACCMLLLMEFGSTDADLEVSYNYYKYICSSKIQESIRTQWNLMYENLFDQ